MVKGISRRVVVVKSPDPHIFDEAIFIVKEDALHRGVTNEEILREAQDIAGNYIKTHGPQPFLSRVPPPVFTLAGAGAMAVIWALTRLVF